MDRPGTATMWLLVMVAESLVYSCHAVVYMTVSPYPARVYENAPPGVPVLYVSAFDNETGLEIRKFRLEPNGVAEYFQVDSGGLVTTARTIDRVIGYQFQFFVFALLMNTVQWKHAIVEVTKKNLYPPKFQEATYSMNLYRYAAPGTRLGRVEAIDLDTDPHNKHFTIFAAPRQLESQYLNVTAAGDVILTRQPAANETALLLTVMALDDGTPPMNDSTVVAVFVRDVNLPGSFCLSTMGGGKTTLCWKNPMPGRSGPGYNVDILGPPGLVIHHHVVGDPDAEEFCVKEPALELYRNYTIQIRLDVNDTSLSGIELSFRTLGQGFSIDCLDEHFDACNFLSPCENGAQCWAGAGGGLNYSCRCPLGWQGRNCTLRDPCGAIPCRNNATCQFLGHELHACICPPDFFGQYCQHFNVCRESGRACKNGGLCEMDDNGTYSCLCLDHFKGADCSVPDPCTPSPCGDQGSCQAENTTHAICKCYRGYYGDRCTEINICETSQGLCKNGGTCKSAGSNAFRCQCTEEYTGSLCESYNACRTVCQNNATCHMTPSGGYNCSCLPAYYGNECQHFNRCHGDPCGNGTCSPYPGLPLCSCRPGYYGDACQHFNACLTDPCGGYGTCHPSGDGLGSEDYECRCSPLWLGERCQYPNACSMGLCQNNATCINIPPNMFSCQCLPGYYDVHCERFNPCEAAVSGSSLCQNGGLCHNITEDHNTTQDGFRCQCPSSHYGDRCERTNPCRSSPCLNGGTCQNLTDTRYTCSCPNGYLGGLCQFMDLCQPPVTSTVSGSASGPLLCVNGGSCATFPDSGALRCLCPEGYLGARCQITDPCFEGSSDNGGLSICSGQGTCTGVNRTLLEDVADNVTDISFLFRCDCDPGFTGRQCEVTVVEGEECAGVVCLHGGVCRTGRCLCLPTFTGPQCATAQCLAEDLNLGKTGRFTWPAATVGETVTVGCQYGARHGNDSEATRRCLPDGAGGVQWSAVDDSNCRELGLLEASRLLNYLNDLTSNPASLGTAEVNNYTTILESLFSYTLMEIEVAAVMMNVISNLADVNVSVTIASNKENKTSERLLSLLDEYTAQVNVTGVDNVSISSANFEVAAVRVVDLSSNFTFVPVIKVGNHTKQLNVSITLPPEVFAVVLNDPNRKENDVTEMRLQMIGHRKSQLFMPEGSSFTRSDLEHQPVLSAVLSGVVVRNLTSPVQYSITNALPSRNYTCVYWDPENRTWSTQGVETTVNSGQTTECLSYHMTSFAVLLDPSPDYQPSVLQERVLTFISYIGSAVSLFCLTLTILTYSLFRSLNKDKSGKILLNLCAALLLLNLVFLINALSGTQDDSGASNGLDDNLAACTAVAVLLHYLLLASLAWMLVEAVEMYRALVTVFNKYAQCYMLKRCLLGWGVPLIIVIITLVVDVKNYQSEGAFCFISRSNLGAYYGSLVAPACVVLVVNTVIFVLVTRVILKPRFNQQKQREAEGITPAQVRGAFTVMFLLGVTWVFGPLAINEAKVVFNYLFCIVNSLQGMLIFVFRCLYNPEVRSCWVQLIKTGTLKKRRGPIRSNVYSDTSSKGECKSAASYPNGHSAGVNHTLSGKDGLHGNHSLGSRQSVSTTITGTTKTALAHTNGWHPKLDGYSPTHSTSSKQVLERRGTKFSTLGFYLHDGGEDGSLKRRAAAVREEDRYGDSVLDDPSLFAQPVDYYETGHQGQVGSSAPPSPALVYSPGGLHDEGELMDYYENIRAHNSVQRQSSTATTTIASDSTNISSSTNSQTSSGSYISDTRQLIRQTEERQERGEDEHRHSSHSLEHHLTSSRQSDDLPQRHDLHHHRRVTTTVSSTSSSSSTSVQVRSREVTSRSEERSSGLKSEENEHTHL